tara:strand:- start:407 stop:520 length:114 start_codon:yes stop_codon:yes gene_type:complete
MDRGAILKSHISPKYKKVAAYKTKKAPLFGAFFFKNS